MTFFWTAAATAAAALGDRVLTSERFFRTAARFGTDILKVVEHFQKGQPDRDDLKSIVGRLASFDATTGPDYATAVEDSGNLRGPLRRLALVVDPQPPAIELAGPPAITSDTQPDRWKVDLPLTKPLKHSVASDGKVLVAFQLKSGNNDSDVRVHPTKPGRRSAGPISCPFSKMSRRGGWMDALMPTSSTRPPTMNARNLGSCSTYWRSR